MKTWRIPSGLTATLAGIDKFFNLLVDWGSYVSPIAAQVLPVSTSTFMGIVGVIEFAVGIAILAGWTRLGAYVASAWLLGVAANLVTAGFYDVAVRDVMMALAAFTLARLAKVREEAPAFRENPCHRTATAASDRVRVCRRIGEALRRNDNCGVPGDHC